MIGGGSNGQGIDISKYLVNFNAADWANTANNYLTNALNQGIAQSNQYNQAAINSQLAAQNQANQAATQGFNMAQALNAPQRLATYGALDAYQDTLGLARPVEGSAQLAQGLLSQAQRVPSGLFQQGVQ